MFYEIKHEGYSHIGMKILDEEVKKKNIPFLNHFKHLLVHSTLHLLGYDHMNDTEAEIMQDIEVKILKKLSIPSPYL